MGECYARPFAHPPKNTGPVPRASPGESGESATLLPVLAYLKVHPSGAIVATLAHELGASVHLTERRLYSLRRQGLVTSEQRGVPPVTTWRCL